MSLARWGALALAVAAATLSLVTPASAAPQQQQDSGAVFTPLSPTRIFDSRTTGSQIPRYGSVSVPIPAGLVPADATAVVFTLTGTNAANPTFLSVGPGTQGNPATSSVNLAAGETRANLVTVAFAHGNVSGFWVGAGPAPADAVVDLAGYYSPSGGSKYTPLAPQRVLDTRGGPAVGPHGTVLLDLSNQVPPGATAVVFNLTGTDVTGPTFVTAYPADEPEPNSSNLNLAPGKDTPDLVTVKVGLDRRVALTNAYNSVDLIADLAGYYSPQSTQAFYSLNPLRVLETRDINGNPSDPIGPGATRKLDLSGWLPAGATGVVANLTATNVTAATVITAWADGAQQPGVSNLNLAAGQTAANLALVPVSPARAIDIHNLTGQIDMIVDVAGYFAPAIAPCTSACPAYFGQNNSGQAADGTTDVTDPPPARTGYGLTGITAITGSDRGAYALRSDGTVWTWGDNSVGELGNGQAGYAEGPTGHPYLSPPPAFLSTLPVQVQGLSNITAIAQNMALSADGTVWTWGANSWWRLGTGAKDETPYSDVPVKVGGLTDVVAIAGDAHNGYALKRDGTVWDWGQNLLGQLGTGVSGSYQACDVQSVPQPDGGPNCASAVPVRVAGLTGITKIAPGFALRSDGTVWHWGPRDVTDQDDPPAQLAVPAGTITDLRSPDGEFAAAVLADGTVWQWRTNPITGKSEELSQVFGLNSVTSVAFDGIFSIYALRSDGTEWHATAVTVPVQVGPAGGVKSIGDNAFAVVN